MQNWKWELIAGLSGGLTFFIVFLIGGNFLISLVCGVIVLAAARLILKRDSGPPEIILTLDQADADQDAALIQQGLAAINRLEQYERQAREPDIRAKITGLISISKRMMTESKVPLDKITKDLITYYMPSLLKILDEYFYVERKNMQSGKVDSFKQDVSHFLDELVKSFEKQLEAMLTDNMSDAKLEMDYLKNVLQSDGFLNEHELKFEEVTGYEK